MIMRLKPNFLSDGPNFHSPAIPLYGNLQDQNYLVNLMFEEVSAAIQSNQIKKKQMVSGSPTRIRTLKK